MADWNLADLFERVADTIPDNEALVCGDQRRTYRQLDERTNRLAHVLQAGGVRPGDHVGCYMTNRAEYVETMLACFKMRAVPININFRYVADELRWLFDNADLVAVVHAPEYARTLDDIGYAFRLQLETGAPFEEALAGASPERDFPPRSGDDLFIIYTGGTTGMPKGVMWRQEDLFFAGMGGGNPMGAPLDSPDDVKRQVVERNPHINMFAVPPLMHGSAELSTFITFNWGDRLVLVPKFDPVEVLRTIEREKVNSMNIVGDAMARPIVEAIEREGPFDLSSLYAISSAGAILSEAVRERLRELVPNVMILDSFGATETGFQGMGTPDSSPDKGLRFMMNERHAVIDESTMRPAEVGVIGRIAQKARVPLGYYKDEKKTAETFVTIDGERYVLLGDMGRIEPDGTVSVLGRGNQCINSGGEKIFPEEVEAALKRHPDVFDAVVVGVPDERWMQRVTAVVQPRPGAAPTLEDLQDHCRKHVAGYKVPRELHLVEQMVRSPSGKADYPWALRVATGATV